MVTELADSVLPLIRTRAGVWQWNVANRHGDQMHDGVDILEGAVGVADPADVYAVTHKALASAVKVIAHADDSSGIIGDACRRLLELHPRAAARAQVPPRRLVEWMMTFQFDDEVDYFELDPVAYAPALGDAGMDMYRSRLDAVRATAPPPDPAVIGGGYSRERWVLEWNDKRLAVLDHDVDAIIRTHARDMRVAAWPLDAARAFEEIGDVDRAIEWASRATDLGASHQSQRAAEYWCDLLARHRPDELIPARLHVFGRWPTASTAASLHAALGERWPEHRDEVLSTLAANPHDAVTFALHTLKDVPLAWEYAHSLDLEGDRTWSTLATAYEKIDPLAVLPIHRRLAQNDLATADAQHYKLAARRLARMRKLAAPSEEAADVDALVAELRETYRRRPRLQLEFDRAGLP